jgi:Domain of unknown function (DUF4382)
MNRRACVYLLWLIGAGLVGCSGDGDGGQLPPQENPVGTVRTTLSDPPTCKGHLGTGELTFNHVWVTVTLVRAHISGNADQDDSGWVTLVDLRDHPKQIDLLSADDTQCVLTVLGSTTGLPPGDYQQIRLHLLSNNPDPGEAEPEPNECGSADRGGFNCAETTSGELKTLLLSSQDRTGIKIPPGQIAGGSIRLESGKSADINIDFNACKSIVTQGNGRLRLKPTLTAGQVSVADSISGRVVPNPPYPPLTTIVVFAEQPDEDGVDRVVLEKLADPEDGSFILCPLPEGSYDIVVGANVAYHTTVTFGVPTGTDLGNIPLEPETGINTSLGTIQGLVTSQGVDNAVEIDVSLNALQEALREGGPLVPVTVPVFGSSTSTLSTLEGGSGCPENTACASYILEVPPSNPLVGTFSTLGTNYVATPDGSVPYSVNARAFNGAEPNCSPPSLTTDQIDGGGPLEVTGGGSVTAKTLTFTGCTEVSAE